MKLVQGAQVIEEGFQGLGSGSHLQTPMDEDVEHGEKAERDVAEVSREVRRFC